MATKKKVYKNYKDYLKSEEWQKLRKLNHNRVKREYDLEELECEVCSNIESDHEMHVHHFIYPKDWNDDKMQYHIVLCKDCHDKIHNDETKDQIEDWLDSPKNRLQFIRKFNNYLLSHENSLLCDEHSEKQDLENIVVKALKKGLINYDAKYVRSYSENAKFIWQKSILGVRLIPWQDKRIFDKMNDTTED